MEEMYNVISGSPKTVLVNDIDSSQTTIEIGNTSDLPSAPNYATIGSDIDNYEVIKYDGISGDDLTGVTRGVEGTAQSFDSGTEVARYITARDINDSQSNIEELESDKSDNPHDNDQHSETYETESGAQSRVDDHEDKSNPHSGSASDNHDNSAHSETFAVDGDSQPPEEHDNSAHSEDYTTTSPNDVDSTNWDDYEIQKDGSDGSGIINFKT